jgi:putative NIF3 family GTP cyclohydrolase 1 type 2
MIKADILYEHLEEDFKLAACQDDWAEMNFNQYITNNFRNRYMGLLADNTAEITRVFTAVFPSAKVIDYLLDSNVHNALLFTHHPMDWDITKRKVFTDISIPSHEALKKQGISIYTLHTPLDKNGSYSTTVNLAKALAISWEEDFCEYFGFNVGVMGVTDCKMLAELKTVFQNRLGHAVGEYPYGDPQIHNGRVALVAGGGNDADVYPLLAAKDINTFITGIASDRTGYPPSIQAHETAKEHKINILSGTHYSTEKFACIEMTHYFQKYGLEADFVPDTPCMQDM